MNKGQANQQFQAQQEQIQIQKSMSSNYLNQRKNGRGVRDFNQDMMQLMISHQNMQNVGQTNSLSTIPKQESQIGINGMSEGIDNAISNKLQENTNELDKVLYLKAQQRLFAQNNKIPSRIISFESMNTKNQEKIKTIPSHSQKLNGNNDNVEQTQETLKTEIHQEATLLTSDSPFNKTKGNQSQFRQKNLNYFQQTQSNSKFSNNLFSSEKKETTSSNTLNKEEQADDKSYKKIDPLSRVRLLKQSSPTASFPQSFNLSQSSVIEKTNSQTNKKIHIKDLKFDNYSIETQGQPQTQQVSQLNNNNTICNQNSNAISSQRNLFAQESQDSSKAVRSQSQNLQNNANKRRFSANINSQQTQTPINQQPEDKKGFSSFLTDYFSSMQQMSPKYNTLINPSDKIGVQNNNLIKKAQVMSQFNKMNLEIYQNSLQQIQLNFPNGPYSSSQTIHSNKQSNDKNQTNQLFIQALIPSQTSKLIQSPHSICSNTPQKTNQNSAYQIFNIEDMESIRQRTKLLPKNRIQLFQSQPSSLQELQNTKCDEDSNIQDQQGSLTTQAKSKIGLLSPKSFTETFSNFKMSKSAMLQKLNHNHQFLNTLQNQEEINHKICTQQQNKDGEQQIPQHRSSKEDIFYSQKEKLKQLKFQYNIETKQLAPITLSKLDVINFEREQGFYSLSTRRTTQPSVFQNATTSSTLTTSRQSLASLSYQPKKKLSTFQSQRDLPTSDTSSNQIDIAPFTNQNKENTHLQNLIQKVDDFPKQLTSNSQSKYRYLKSNISLDHSFDNEDEDFYNYTQNVKEQKLNSPQI